MEHGESKKEERTARRNEEPVERAAVLRDLERSIAWIPWLVDDGYRAANGTSARLQFRLALLVFARECAKRRTTTEVASVIHGVFIPPLGTP